MQMIVQRAVAFFFTTAVTLVGIVDSANATEVGQNEENARTISLVLAHKQFVRSQRFGDWETLRSLIATAMTAPQMREDILNSHVEKYRARTSYGIIINNEIVKNMIIIGNGENQVAELTVISEWSHPIEGFVSKTRILYALSTTGGRSWKFNVFDCINEVAVKKFVPGYDGNPRILPSSN